MDVTLVKEYSNNNKFSKIYIDSTNAYYVVAVNDMGTGFRIIFNNLEESINYAEKWVNNEL
jgi:hypothetical protein